MFARILSLFLLLLMSGCHIKSSDWQFGTRIEKDYAPCLNPLETCNREVVDLFVP